MGSFRVSLYTVAGVCLEMRPVAAAEEEADCLRGLLAFGAAYLEKVS